MADMLAEGRLGAFSSEEDLKAAFDHAVARHLDVGQSVADLGSGAGSLLNIQKMLTDTKSSIADATQKARMYGGDTEANRSLLVQRIRNGDGSAITNGQFISPLRRNMLEGIDGVQGSINQGTKTLVGYYINSLLGLKTIAVKGTSDLLKGGVVQPMEQAYRGIYRGATTQDWTQFTQAGQQYVGMVSSLFDGIKLAGRTLWRSQIMEKAGLDPALGVAKEAMQTGRQVLDTSTAGGFAEGGSHATAFSVGDGTVIASLQNGNYVNASINALGNVVGLPSRLINSLHELSQQVIYRGRVFSKAATEWELQNHSLGDGHTMAVDKGDFIAQALKNSFGENGEALDMEAMRYAQDGTYSRPLSDQGTTMFEGLAAKTQDWAGDHPAARLVIPFIKAPTRLLQDVGTYTPMLQAAKLSTLRDLTAGGQAAETAAAKLATGGTLWGGAMALALSGHLTDGGPSDPHAMKQKMDTGWRPHALILTDPDGTPHYYPVDRIDPFGQILAMAADASTILPHLKDEEVGTVAAQMALAVTKDSLSKNYLKNFSDTLEVLTTHDPEQKAEEKWTRLLNGMIGGLIPSMLANSSDDPYMREVRGILDALKHRVPGLVETLDPQRNILGEPIEATPGLGPKMLSPFYHSVGKANDLVSQVLSHVAENNPHGFLPPPKTLRLAEGMHSKGIDLTQVKMPNGKSGYDRLQELIGDLGNGSPSLRDTLGNLFASNPAFTDPNHKDGNRDHQGLQFDRINEILGERRQAAKAFLLRENPALLQALLQDQRNAAAVTMGGGDAPTQAVPGMKR